MIKKQNWKKNNRKWVGNSNPNNISKANVLFVLLSLKPYNYDYILLSIHISIYLLWIMNFIYVYLVPKALLVCKLLPCISLETCMLQLNRKCIRIKINDFCWSATRTQKTKPTKSKSKKKKKKQKITQSYDFTKRSPSSWGATSQYFSRLNLTLYEPNTNTIQSNPTQPIQTDLIKLFSHNSLITPDNESERGKRTL